MEDDCQSISFAAIDVQQEKVVFTENEVCSRDQHIIYNFKRVLQKSRTLYKVCWMKHPQYSFFFFLQVNLL